MILYEVSGSQMEPRFFKKLKDARQRFAKEKAAQDDAELFKVRVGVSAQLVLELLNGYWANAREEIVVIDSCEYVPNDERK